MTLHDTCHMDGCHRVADMQIRAKLPDGDIVIPMCLEHAKAIVACRDDYEMYDDSSMEIDLEKGMTIITSAKRFRKI